MPEKVEQVRSQRGQLIGDKYILGDILGTGGMGIVYCASQPKLGRTVAVKMLRPELVGNAYMVRRFRSEAFAESRLSHPNIAAVIDFDTMPDGTLYLVLEHVRGQRLAQLIHELGPLPLRRIAALCGQLLAALDETHAAGIVHADVKSDNILVQTMRDGRDLAKLIDFGLARFVDEVVVETDTPMLSGTPEYLAPEVIRGEFPSPASDLYAVGVILYEMLTGTTPFAGGTSSEIFARHLDEEVVSPCLRSPDRQIPPKLERVVLRALEKRPSARFPDAAAFAAALLDATPAIDPIEIRRSLILQPVFSTEAPTGDWGSVEPIRPRRLAVGTNPTEIARPLLALRQAIRDAIATGDSDLIAAAYLGLSRELVDAGQVAIAVSELEEAIELLTVAWSDEVSGPLWRLLLTLASLHDGLGDRMLARDSATAGLDHAGRADSTVGKDRARALIERLSYGRAPAA